MTLIVSVVIVSVPQFMGARLYTVLTPSMRPTYEIGDLIYVFPESYEDIKEGDSITYFINSQGTVVTHRVIEKNDEDRELRTKGDNSDSADVRPIRYSNVVGVVKFHIRGMGNIIKPISTVSGKIIISCAIGICVVFMNLLSYLMKKEPTKDTGEKNDEEKDA